MKARPLLRLGLAAVLVTAAEVLLALSYGEHASATGDPGPYPPRSEELRSEEDIARAEPATLGRVESKLALTREVMDGRLPLAVAARKFQELDRGMPEPYWVGFRRQIPGRNDADRYCRQVLNFVKGELSLMAADGRRHPDHDAILGRLCAELERLLADDSLKFKD
jgi:hypothetical protein